MSTYIIGDIHGYLNTLERLLIKINFKQETDSLWFTGDLINGGPQSIETIRFVKSLSNAICILGNHDITLIACYYNKNLLTNIFNQNNSNKEKLNGIIPVLEAPDCKELITWLQQQSLAWFSQEFNLLLVHAGVHPAWDLKKTLILAKELETSLKSTNIELYNYLYGNKPDNWDDNLTSWSRMNCIVNYLTRIRFCKANGQLEFFSKGEALEAPDGYMPWYNVPNRKTKDITVVFGHWSALAGKANHPNVIALDTGCRWGKQLTAYCLETQKFFSVENNAVTKINKS